MATPSIIKERRKKKKKRIGLVIKLIIMLVILYLDYTYVRFITFPGNMALVKSLKKD